MKKLLKNIAVFAIAALLMFTMSVVCFAESDDALDIMPPAETAPQLLDESDSADDVPLAGSATASATAGETDVDAEEEFEPEPVQFVLIEKIAKLFDGEHNTALIMLIAALAVFAVLTVVAILTGKNASSNSFGEVKAPVLKILIMGALSLSLSFVLSYIKLFSMPFGGSITLCSMLPIMVYAAWVGPKYGFLVALCYAGLQIVQDAWIVHPVQFIFDYILAFTALGFASLFRSEKLIPVGILVAGFARMICSSIAGLYYGVPEGLEMNLFAYTLIYNFMTIGIDTIICLVVYIIPPVRKMFTHLRETYLA